jgi:hypothetical protein
MVAALPAAIHPLAVVIIVICAELDMSRTGFYYSHDDGELCYGTARPSNDRRRDVD